MESDYQVLCWFHSRLTEVYGESELYDYMHALRRIIANTPPDRRSPPFSSNSLQEMRQELANPLIEQIALDYGLPIVKWGHQSA